MPNPTENQENNAQAAPEPAEHTPMDKEAFDKLFDDGDDTGADEGDDQAAGEAPEAPEVVDKAPQAPAAPVPDAPTPTDNKPKPADDLAEPEGLSERAKTRWATLAERAKQLPEISAKLAETQEQVQNIKALVNESRLAPDEFTNMLELGKRFKSSDPQDMKQALAQLDELRADLAMRSGLDVPGVDPLAKFSDLAQAVETMELGRDHALEIARSRIAAQRSQQQTAASQQQQQAVQGMQAAAQQTESALQARASTPGHDAKVAYIKTYLSNPANQAAFVKNYEPHQWAAATMMMYDAYTPPPPPPPVEPPLRPSVRGHGGQVRTGATKFEDVFNSAFDRVLG